MFRRKNAYDCGISRQHLFSGSAMLVPTAQAAVENRAKDAVTERIIFFFIFIYFKFNRKSS